MNRKNIIGVVAILALAILALAQSRKQRQPVQVAAPQAVPRDVKVTNGPVIRSTTATIVDIFWSTNVSSDTLVRYGTRADNLDHVARSPWGGLNHRVQLQDLSPDTTYYYQVGTSNPQGSVPMKTAASFKTAPDKPR